MEMNDTEERCKKRSRLANIWASRLIPLCMLASFAHSIYLLTYIISVKFLLRPNRTISPQRTSAAVAILVFEALLVILVLASWLRLSLTMWTDADRVPKGTRPIEDEPEVKPELQPPPGNTTITAPATTPNTTPALKYKEFLDREEVAQGLSACPLGIEDFYSKEVFSCGWNGLPRFCNKCWNWKPDRAHHASELNRCLRRYDHYCPWVGGAVTEYNNKFFIQFCFFAISYTILVFVSALWALLESQSDCHASSQSSQCPKGSVKVNLIAGIAISSFFGFLGQGIFLRFTWAVLCNQTTIEDLASNFPNHHLAVHINESEIPRRTETIGPDADFSPPFGVISYPLPNLHDHNKPATPESVAAPNLKKRTFAILPLKSGSNIWNLGYYRNFKSIMGNNIWDWFLPVRRSPCIKHNDGISAFELGKDFRELEKEFFPHRYNGDRRLDGESLDEK